MKLRAQLLIGFLSLTVLILFMGSYGIFSLNRIYEFTRAMAMKPDAVMSSLISQIFLPLIQV